MLDLVSKKKNMRWDSLETSFFELVSILSFLNKKKGFSLFWIQIGENFGSFLFVQWLAEMFEPTFGLGGAIFLSLMGPLEIFQKKKKTIKVAPTASLTKVDLRKALSSV